METNTQVVDYLAVALRREKRLESSRRYHANNREKERKQIRLYRANNIEKVRKASRESNRRWRANNIEKARERFRRWVENNPEKARASRRESDRRWKNNNPEKARESAHRSYRKNPEKRIENVRRWRANNPEKMREKGIVDVHRRRARKLKTTGAFTTEQFNALCAHFRHHCLKCGRPRKLTPDHVIPLAWADRPEFAEVALGDIDNIQPLCRSCNCRKNAKHVDYRTNPHRHCVTPPLVEDYLV